MLVWLSKEFLLAAVFSLAVAVVTLSWGGPPRSYDQLPPENRGSENSQNNQNVTDQQVVFQIECDPNCTAKRVNTIINNSSLSGSIKKVFQDPVIVLTGGILIANFLLVFAVLRQIKESRESNEARLRAYVVSVVGTHLRQGGSRGLKFEFRPVILNTGQTPAYEVRSISRLRFMSIQEAANFDFVVTDPGASSQVTLGPRQDRFIATVYDGYLSRNELRQYKRAEKSLYLYGTTWYRDAFHRPRHTNHCYMIGWWNKRWPPLWQTVARHSDSN